MGRRMSELEDDSRTKRAHEVIIEFEAENVRKV